MRDASSRLIDYLKMEKDPDIKMPRRSTTTKKSETGTRRKTQPKTLEELESRKVIECRCSPVSVFTTINFLTKEQKIEVDKMGFSSMKAIQDWKIDRRLFLALAKAYNTITSKLELVVGDIDVTTDKIGLALGLPSIGKSFPEEEDWTSEQKRLVAPFKSIIYYHKDTFGDKENYMGPPPPWIAYWDKEKLAKKLTQESSKQRPTGIVTLLVKQGGVDAKFAKNTTGAPTKKRGAKELNKDNTTKEKKERFDEQNNDNKMSKEDYNVSDEQKDKERPEWREIVQSAVQAFLEIEDCDIYTPSPVKKTQEPVVPSIPSFSLMIHEENKIGEEKKVIDEKNKIGEEEKVIEDNKLTEVDKDKIYFWATDDRLNKDETLCILKDIPRAMLVREDIMSMLPRHQINNMGEMFSHWGHLIKRKKKSYVLLPDDFGKNGDSFFEQKEIPKHRWLLGPCCYDFHWWLYAYDIYEKRLFVLDSLYKEAKGDRVQLDIYANKLIQQMVSIAVPNYELPKNDLIPIYLNLPRQSNNYDCGLFVIKWVEMWNPSSIENNVSNMPEWDEFECVNLRKQLVIQMLTSLSNALLKDVINKSEKYRVVKPTPAQSSPYIVCNTDELMIECLGSAGKGFRKKTVAKKRRN
ncbi:hypothetical protein Ahy_Scaffold1g107219 [Arachis hypogaea]|uniref:Ubiquitin-like protease family profile domain-containing protein n=1 Tax=Arachis hypogaea TaxID=3818 RepID=A0A444WUV1_ARAHY|nr:hypothetical protein Ahy_Scaffold1g107219 [Arachis hypogaea]